MISARAALVLALVVGVLCGGGGVGATLYFAERGPQGPRGERGMPGPPGESAEQAIERVDELEIDVSGARRAVDELDDALSDVERDLGKVQEIVGVDWIPNEIDKLSNRVDRIGGDTYDACLELFYGCLRR